MAKQPIRWTERTRLTPAQRRYIDELERIGKRLDNLDNATIRRTIELLQQLRKDIGATLLDNPSEFTTWRLGELQQSVGANITRFEGMLEPDIARALSGAHQLGGEAVTSPILAAGIRGSFNQLIPAQINVAVDFSAELVKNIGDDMRGRINTELRLAVLGQKSPFEVMKAITTTLGVKASDGIWGTYNRPEVVRGVAARAEAIFRTETTRMYNLSHYSRQQQIASEIPGLMKGWNATGDRRTRITHLRAHANYSFNPIPVDKPFIVGGAEMMYPGDPSAPAKETIRCRCRSTTIVPSIGVIETPGDRLILAEMEKRKNV